jgi:nicotinic acetylcholine receptor
MPNWLRKTFLDFMPKLLGMRRPKVPPHPGADVAKVVKKVGKLINTTAANHHSSSDNTPTGDRKGIIGDRLHTPVSISLAQQQHQHHPLCHGVPTTGGHKKQLLMTPTTAEDHVTSDFYPLTPDAQRAIEAIEYITEHLKQDEEYKMVGVSFSFYNLDNMKLI